jgi:Na+-driven multidrug efflux pump
MESPLLQEEGEEENVSQPKLNRQSSVQDEPPYSVRNELTYFFKKGLPLGLSATLEWGVPPLVAMVFAGHVEENSDELQTALGFGRVFYNCTVLMILIGLMNYHYSGVPGLVGANRRERLPVYTFRSIVLTTICLLPMFCLQFFSGDIMHVCGIERHIADEITTYTSYMIISSILLMLEAHIENVFINLGYTKSAAFNSFLTGLGVDVVSTYLLIFRMNLGTKGAAFAQIVVKSARILVWIGLGVRFRLGKYFFGKSNEKVFDRDEVKEYFALGIPRILTFFTGWLVFELQIMALANIQGISSAQKAAGAIWV